MKSGYVGPIALVFALALGGCGDDDSSSSTSAKNDPFSNAGGSHANVNSGGTTGGLSNGVTGTSAGSGGASAGPGGASAGPGGPGGGSGGASGLPVGPGTQGDGGMMMPPMMDGMKPDMMMETMPMLVCPTTAPVNGTPCTAGRGMCTFGTLKCRCKKEGWSCETAIMMPAGDGGMPMP